MFERGTRPTLTRPKASVRAAIVSIGRAVVDHDDLELDELRVEQRAQRGDDRGRLVVGGHEDRDRHAHLRLGDRSVVAHRPALDVVLDRPPADDREHGEGQLQDDEVAEREDVEAVQDLFEQTRHAERVLLDHRVQGELLAGAVSRVTIVVLERAPQRLDSGLAELAQGAGRVRAHPPGAVGEAVLERLQAHRRRRARRATWRPGREPASPPIRARRSAPARRPLRRPARGRARRRSAPRSSPRPAGPRAWPRRGDRGRGPTPARGWRRAPPRRRTAAMPARTSATAEGPSSRVARIVSTAQGAPSRSMIRSGGSRWAIRAQISTSAARGVAARASPEQATRRTSGSGSASSGTICSTSAGMPGRVSSRAARARVVGRRELRFALRLGKQRGRLHARRGWRRPEQRRGWGTRRRSRPRGRPAPRRCERQSQIAAIAATSPPPSTAS